ncbi:MAG: S41 family peptidase [Granulosicoccus sp.]
MDAAEIFVNPDAEPKIGYLVMNSFLETSRAELTSAFETFEEGEITDLILDLRYNTGGRVSVAAHLASLIVGNALAGQLFYEFEFNDKNPDPNERLLFESTEFDLGLSRVAVLVTEDTASAAEIVISGLQPYLDVVIFAPKTTVAPTTIGQPFMSRAEDRCGLRLNIVRAEGYNAERSSVVGGLTAQCCADDDITVDWGSSIRFDDMVWDAIVFIAGDPCSSCASFGSVPEDESRIGRLFELPVGGAQLD